MALSFPLALPTVGVLTQSFELMRADLLSQDGRGRLGGVQAGWPLWRMSLTLGPTDPDETEAWRVFVPALRGAMFHFYGRDLSRPLPRAYRDGLPGGFSGAASSWSQAISAGQAVLTLNGLPAGFVLTPNDYVDFRWSTSKRALVRAMEGAVAGAGGSASFAVEPPVPALVPASATASLDHPACLMRLDPRETALGAMDAHHSPGGTIVALQDLVP